MRMKDRSLNHLVMPRRALWLAVASALWLIAALRFVLPAHAETETAARVEIAQLNTSIDQFTAGYVERVLSVARDEGAQAVVIRLDTPGGDADATYKLNEQILASPVPVVVYVSPAGARAGSAGVFITYAAHIAAMAPGTNIGAAHPVGLGGEDITGTIGTKITNDAVAHIRGYAVKHGRNVDWAEKAVRESVSITDKEALDLHVIDLVATDMNDLLNQLDGRQVNVNGLDVTLHTRGAPTRTLEMNFFEEFFHFLLDPNVATILLSIGSLAITVELFNPGATLPAIAGVICLTLAAVALYNLPTNWAALILIAAAIVMFVLDIKVNSLLLTLGGITAFVLGAFFLFRPFTPPEPTAPEIAVSPFVIAGLAVVLTAFFLFVLGAAVRSRNVPVVTGTGVLLGASGQATTDLAPNGTVQVRSELWTAVADGGPIQKGERVRVTGVEGLRLHVVTMDGK